MWLLGWYRFYVSVFLGISLYIFFIRNIWICIACIVIIRTIWFFIELLIRRYKIQKDYNKHISDFKRQNGPYGIRIANKADNDWRIKESLSEVFMSNMKKLRKTVEQLEMMDTLFNAGLRPEGDEFLLHDLKFKYGKFRLENQNK